MKWFSQLPSSEWGGHLQEDGTLVSEREDPVDHTQYTLKAIGGLSESLLFGMFVWMYSLLGTAVIGEFLLVGP